MTSIDRRTFLRTAAQAAGAAAAVTVLPASIRDALAIPAHNATRSINDVEHIVILMQENRSFDHYFGALRGVRGFGDRFPIPLESGKSVWHQSNGTKEITPFHFDESTMNAALIIDTAHNFPDQQGAWAQGKFGEWPMYKGDTSMGYYKRSEAPFQWALADAFTICDSYFCSLRSATDPNRTFLWSGSNFDPVRREAGLNSDMSTAEVVNLRCWITGTFPTPGYTYYGSALPWKTIPEVLQDAGVSWRIYQDPNDNWTGAMNGALAFEGFRNAKPGSPIYKNGLSHWSLDDLKHHVMNGTLPAVSWVCPSQLQSEHPGAPSSPARGGDFTQQVLEALTANPKTWSKTVFLVTFDENDGLFDHLPSPAVPSYNLDGTLAGKSTVDLHGMYFETDGSLYNVRY
jgi:phospholipase C